jgi:hypothetical protein
LLFSANRILESTIPEVEVCFAFDPSYGDSPQGAIVTFCIVSPNGFANLQRTASPCGVADPKSVTESQNQTVPIEVPALPVKLRPICSQLAVKFQS